MMSKFTLYFHLIPFILVYITSYMFYVLNKKEFKEIYTHKGGFVFTFVVSFVPIFNWIPVLMHLVLTFGDRIMNWFNTEIEYKDD